MKRRINNIKRIIKARFHLFLIRRQVSTLRQQRLNNKRPLALSSLKPRIAHNYYFITLNSNLRRPLALAFAVVLVLSSILALTLRNTPLAKAAWFSNDWNYRQKIIIDHNKVSNSTQTDFPVLIKITDSTNPIFSSKVQDDGDDIRFTRSDETTELNFEIETYSKDTNELWAWVKIPSLSHTTDTTIYLYYGNATATAKEAAFKQAVWSNGYAGVWHMGEEAGNFSNSANNVIVGVDYVSATGKIGKIASGQEFDGTDDYIEGGAGSNYNMNTLATAAWIKFDTLASNYIMSIDDGTNRRWSLYYRTDGPGLRLNVFEGNVAKTKDYSWTPNIGQWYRVIGIADGTKVRIYVNGVDVGSPVDYTGNIDTDTEELRIGRKGDNTFPFDGSIDEASISSTARSADWIATEYANQNDPDSFYSIRTEITKFTGQAQVMPAGWFDSEWGNRQPITIDHTKVPNTDQENFPVLVKITDVSNDLWAKAQADGDDILFTSSDGTTKLAHEIEKYDAVTHELWAWVKIPTLATASDTTIYMYYGNSSSANQQSKTAVWSNGYAGVWHMNQAGGNITDSTLNNTTGVGYGNTALTNGSIGSGISFDGSGDYISLAANVVDTNSAVTYSAWVKINAYANSSRIFRDNGNSSVTTETDQLRYWQNINSVVNSVGHFNTSTNMRYLAFKVKATTYGGDGKKKIFVNGASVSESLAESGAITAGIPHTLGANSPTENYLNGIIDEFRYSTVDRPADWIATEYNNQNSPETFMTFGTAETSDSFAPNNPTSITALYSEGGSAITNNSGTDSTPYYSWPEPEVAGGATDQTGQYISGVAGYYSYFGTSCGAGGADPTLSRGVLSDTGSGLHYSSDTNIPVPDLTTNAGAYCLRIKTKDVAGNVSAATWQAATYNFDLTAPSTPTFISANPAGYSSTNSFSFVWPAATDNAGGSGIQGYQYKRGGDSGDAWSATQIAVTISSITSYATGANIFLVRSVDNAGNYSDEVQTTYYYSNNAPTKPTSLEVTPEISASNSFAFSWTAPVHDVPIASYGYSINALPTEENLTWTNSDDTSLSADSFATQQGINTLYLVAKDDSGAYALTEANYASVTFDCQTSAPPIPTNTSISDSSNRAYSTYSLTIKWSAGSGQDSNTFDHYLIERSTNGSTFGELATTVSTAYIDVSSLSNTTAYYYRIKAVDNAGSASASSTIISRIPTGKYTTPPTIVQGPDVSAKASTATIKWVTSRGSTAGVRFGASENNLDRSQIDPTESTEHSITIPGLQGGKRYYYQVQSLDNDRDYASDDAYSAISYFETLSLPVISDVKISNITLSSAELSWTTSTASNADVSYGTTIAYGENWQDQDSYTTNHTYKLKDLSHTTTYHFKITGIDQDGNTLISDDYVFDTLPMPKISAVNFETDLTGTEPKSYITWTTNVATTSSVDYTPKNASANYEESQSSYVTSHKVELSRLSDNTSYSFFVYGTDQFGNKTTSDEYFFSTPFDSRPALITNVSVEPSNVGLNKQDKAQIVVSWHTDEPTTSQVEYGEGVTGSYTSKTAEDKTLTNEHFVIISDLKPNQPYHLRAVSKDKGENISVSEESNTIPGEVPKSIIQTMLQTFEGVFGWISKIF